MVPAWPWHGLLPDGPDTRPLLAFWEVVRAELPEVSLDTPPPPAALLDALARLDATAAEVDDPGLRALTAAFREQSTALGLWTQ
jgi:hypothetical protein